MHQSRTEGWTKKAVKWKRKLGWQHEFILRLLTTCLIGSNSVCLYVTFLVSVYFNILYCLLSYKLSFFCFRPTGGSDKWTATACDCLSLYLTGAIATIILQVGNGANRYNRYIYILIISLIFHQFSLYSHWKNNISPLNFVVNLIGHISK